MLDAIGRILGRRCDPDTVKRYQEEMFDISGATVPAIRYTARQVDGRSGRPDGARACLDAFATSDAGPQIARVSPIFAPGARGRR
jgi:hypothetical protein